jgi:hypothetical protein
MSDSTNQNPGSDHIIKQNAFRYKPNPYIIGAENGGQEKEPEIQIIKEGEQVTGIVVTCSCGRVIDIECQ